MKCEACGNLIPRERIEALPATRRCVQCSTEQPRKTYMVFGHKTAGELVQVPAENAESVRQADRAHRRSR